MALIQCKECKKEVSKKADKCPHCGAPLKAKRYGGVGCLFIIILFIVLVSAIVNKTTRLTEEAKKRVELDKGAKKITQKDIPSISNIQIIDFHLEPSETGSILYIIGELKNNNKVAVGVELQAIIRDDNGKIVDSKTFWPASTKNIPAGSSWPIKSYIDGKGTGKKGSLKVIDVRIWD